MTFEDICDFHYRFELIHPFQDGNGRVGRLVMFGQCLANGIMPFIVTDAEKAFYYRGLAEYARTPGFLRDTLRLKGNTALWREYAGGHDYIIWRGALADGLIALFGR